MKAVNFNVDLDMYELDAIKFVAYTFTEQGYVKIEKRTDHNVIVKIESNKDPDTLEKIFFNELLHQSLRIKIAEQNSKIRERMVLQALMSALRPDNESERNKQNVMKEIADKALEEEINKLLEEAESGSYKDDPFNISLPWEEKNKH